MSIFFAVSGMRLCLNSHILLGAPLTCISVLVLSSLCLSGRWRLTILIGITPLRGSHRAAPIACSRFAGLWLDGSIIIPRMCHRLKCNHHLFIARVLIARTLPFQFAIVWIHCLYYDWHFEQVVLAYLHSASLIVPLRPKRRRSLKLLGS